MKIKCTFTGLFEPLVSEINFIQYPDGQQDCSINIGADNNIIQVVIEQSISSFNDIEKILCVKKYLDNINIKKVILLAPYIMGLRSDRQFNTNGIRYVADILSPIINSMNFYEVRSYDPHSYVAENCINNFITISRKSILVNAVCKGLKFPFKITDTYLISPDAGAFAKSKELDDVYNFKDVLVASKKRNQDGSITTYLPTNFDINADVFITDDICDGGGTFLGLRKTLRDCGHTGKVYIFTTHSMFSKGMKAVLPHFDHMWTTNSFPFIADEDFPGQISDKLTIINV